MCLCAAANTALLQAAGQALNAEVAELKLVNRLPNFLFYFFTNISLYTLYN